MKSLGWLMKVQQASIDPSSSPRLFLGCRQREQYEYLSWHLRPFRALVALAAGSLATFLTRGMDRMDGGCGEGGSSGGRNVSMRCTFKLQTHTQLTVSTGLRGLRLSSALCAFSSPKDLCSQSSQEASSQPSASPRKGSASAIHLIKKNEMAM